MNRIIPLPEHFLDPAQEKHAAETGMWIFLGSECLFFGGLFTALIVYRMLYPDVFSEGTRHLSFALGTVNTAVLLTSSFTMAMAVKGAEDRSRLAPRWLLATAVLGLLFLLIKAGEYYLEWREQLVPALNLDLARFSSPRIGLFFLLYFLMTGIHAFHLTIGIGLVGWLARRLPSLPQAGAPATEVIGLYWHFVDLVWVFLYPGLYLMGRG